MPEIRIDLYSDTLSLPTPEMRRFACFAPVGDEQKGEDPSVNQLQEMVAEMLGKEDAVFLPSGTMCNQISLAVHCRPGDVILLDRTAHPLIAESGGTAILAAATAYPIDGPDGMFTPEQVSALMFPPSRYRPTMRVVSIEQTTNAPGGRIWPLEQLREVCGVAHEWGLATHMDGARLFNASVASGIDVSDYAATLDSVWIDLSKGLGAPVGAVLAGSREFIEEAWQWKQRIGGAMRQAGIIAAAGIHALRHHITRLAQDHENARRLARQIAEIPGLGIDLASVETNIVRFETSGLGVSPPEFARRLEEEEGVRVSTPGPFLRAVTYLDISESDVDEAAAAMRRLARRIGAGEK